MSRSLVRLPAVRSMLVTLALAGATRRSAAQGVLVAPHGLFIDARTRAGALELYNPGDGAAEIGITTLFGYPVSDSLGQVTLRTQASPPVSEPSAAQWIRVLPQRLVLKPHERQTVRVLVKPPAGLGAGEYWSRLVVDARAAAGTVEADTNTTIAVGLALQVRTVLALFYRNGAVKTGVVLGDPVVARRGDTLAVIVPLTRTGNAAYLGNVRATLRSAAGAAVGTFEGTVGVYYSLAPRFTLPISKLPAGRYLLEIEVSTTRPDLTSDVLLAVPTQTRMVDVTIAAHP